MEELIPLISFTAHSEDPQPVIHLSVLHMFIPRMCNPWCAGHQLKVKVAWMGVWACGPTYVLWSPGTCWCGPSVKKVMHACVHVRNGWAWQGGSVWIENHYMWYVPNAKFKRLLTSKLPHQCVLNFALDMVELSSKREKHCTRILCSKITYVHKLHSWIHFLMRFRLNHQIPCYWAVPTIHAFMQCMVVCHFSFAKVESDGKAQSLASPLGAGRWRRWWSRQFLQILIIFSFFWSNGHVQTKIVLVSI